MKLIKLKLGVGLTIWLNKSSKPYGPMYSNLLLVYMNMAIELAVSDQN